MPRDDVEVVTASGKDAFGADVQQATIVDRKANRCWSGSGKTVDAAHTEALKGFLGDRRAREYVGENG